MDPSSGRDAAELATVILLDQFENPVRFLLRFASDKGRTPRRLGGDAAS